MDYTTIIDRMKKGERFKDGGYELALVQDANERWHLVCVAQTWVDGVSAGEKYMSFPMELGAFVDWADRLIAQEVPKPVSFCTDCNCGKASGCS